MRGVLILRVAAPLLLVGCASLSESECRGKDWGALGRADGQRGRPAAELAEHREACARHGIEPDTEAYRREYREGLRTYCTAAGGYVAGRRGDSYEGVCTKGQGRVFSPAFRDGRRVHALLRELEELQRRLDDLEREPLTTGDVSPDARTRRHFERSELRREYDQRQREAERLDERYALRYKVDPLRDLDYKR